MKACVAALQKYPNFNSSLEGDHLVMKKYWNVAFAADTPQGLLVPVIKNADEKGVLEIAQESAALAAKARDGKLAPGDMQGATFTISSLGGIGGTYFTPIINAPEVAILGVCKAQMQPVWNGSEFKPRLILPLSLSWDHRVVDGAGAARFNTFLAGLLGDARRMPSRAEGGPFECDVLVLGSGPGGYAAAFRAADLGQRVILVERYKALGGVCLNVGCIPSKALLHVAALMDGARDLAAHGISFGDARVEVEKLRAWKEKVVGRLSGGVAMMAKARK